MANSKVYSLFILALSFTAQAAHAQEPFGGFFASPFSTPGIAPDINATPRARVYIRPKFRPKPAVAASHSFCVRTCDGRYFPYPAGRDAADVKDCNAVCPATEMKLYSGSEIRSATSDQGKPYEKLANAFRFQREMVSNCTCNARMGLGLTPISARDDRTLRTGDIIAEAEGLMVATVSEGSRRRKGSIVFRPLSGANARMLGLPRASLR